MAKQNTNILAVIRYHVWWPGSNDPFYKVDMNDVAARVAYYTVSGVPASRLDGQQGAIANSTVRSRANVESPLSIELWNDYDPGARQGTVTAKFKNTSAATSVSGKIQFALCETGIFFAAPNGVPIHNQTMLDMLPNANGEPVALAPGDSIEKSRDYTVIEKFPLNPPQNTNFHKVPPESCQIVVFVQNSATKEIFQAENLWVTSTQGMDVGSGTPAVNGGGDNLNPGETGNLVVTIANTGDKPLTDVRGTLASTDPYITITGAIGDFGTIAPHDSTDNRSTPFVVTAEAATPSGHSADFTLTLRSSNNFKTDVPLTLSVKSVGETSPPAPARVELGPVRPNPMRDGTAITFGLPRMMPVSVKIYSAEGARVKTLVAGTSRAGRHQVRWDGSDGRGARAANGIYFCELVAGNPSESERLAVKFTLVR